MQAWLSSMPTSILLVFKPIYSFKLYGCQQMEKVKNNTFSFHILGIFPFDIMAEHLWLPSRIIIFQKESVSSAVHFCISAVAICKTRKLVNSCRKPRKLGITETASPPFGGYIKFLPLHPFTKIFNLNHKIMLPLFLEML